MSFESHPVESRDKASDGKLWVLAVYICYLLGLHVIGLVIAYVKRGDLRGTLWESHLAFAIRTFWLGLAGLIFGIVLTIVAVGFLVLWALGIWMIIRAVFGIIRALGDQPIRNPATWLIDL